MAAIGWTAIKNALAAWALAGSGLPVGKVIWTYPGGTEGGPRPEPPYLAMSLTNVRPMGQAWKEQSDVVTDDGPQLRVRHRCAHMATLDLQLFADQGSGEEGAVARLHDAVAALDVHVEALNDAGIGIGEIGPIRLVAGRVNQLLEPRAVGEVELHLGSELESYVDYIERVMGTVEIDAIASMPFEEQLEAAEES